VVQIERERALKWGKMLAKWHKYWGTDKLHKRVNKGIPNSVRGAVWKHVLDIDGVKEVLVYEVSESAAVITMACLLLIVTCMRGMW
jgi:hypothetical protein